jgi:hypothetical protein
LQLFFEFFKTAKAQLQLFFEFLKTAKAQLQVEVVTSKSNTRSTNCDKNICFLSPMKNTRHKLNMIGLERRFVYVVNFFIYL